MSGRWRAGSWQDGMAKGFSRLFSRSPAAARQSKDGERPEPSQKVGSSSAVSGEERDSPGQDSELFQDSQRVDENSCSSDTEENPRVQEVTSTHESPVVPPNLKTADSDKQSKDPFLQFLGQLFHFTPKSDLKRESKLFAVKDDDCKAEEDLEGQRSHEGEGQVNTDQAKDLSSTCPSTNREAAASSLTPASSQDTEEGSASEITDAQMQVKYKESAPAVTYATYRGSQQIRKLLRRRTHMQNVSSERQETPGTDTGIVTKNGNLENVTVPNAETEGCLSEKEVKDEAEPGWKRTDNERHASNSLAPENCSSTSETSLPSNNTGEARTVPVCNQLYCPESISQSEANSEISLNSSCQDTFTLDVDLTNNKLDEKESIANGLMEKDFQPVANISGLENVTNSCFQASNQEVMQNEIKSISNKKRWQINENLKLTDSLCSDQITGESELQKDPHISQENSVLQMNTTPETTKESTSDNQTLNTVETGQTVRVKENVQKMQDHKLGIRFASHESTSSDRFIEVQHERENSRAFEDFDSSKDTYTPEKTKQTTVFEYKSESTRNVSPDTVESRRASVAETSQGLGDANYAKFPDPALETDNATPARLSLETEAFQVDLFPLTVQVPMETIPHIKSDQHLTKADCVNGAETSLYISRPSDVHLTKTSVPEVLSYIDHSSIAIHTSAFGDISMDKTSTLTHSPDDNSEINLASSAPLSDCETVAKITPPAFVSEDDSLAKISPPAPLSENDSVINISPPFLLTEDDTVANISPSGPVSEHDTVAKISPPAHLSEGNTIAKIAPSALVSEDNSVAKISLPALVSEADNVSKISPSSPVSEVDSVVNIFPPTPVSEGDTVIKIFPLTFVSEDVAVAKVSSPTLLSEGDPSAGTLFLAYAPNYPSMDKGLTSSDVSLTKVLVKSIDVNKVKILSHSMDPEVIHVSKIEPSALEPEYICLANLSPLSNESPDAASANISPTLESGDVTLNNISAPDFINDSIHRVEVSPSSMMNGNDSIVTFPTSKSDDINKYMIVTESDKKITSSVELKNVSLSDMCPHALKSTVASTATTSVSALRLEGSNQTKIKNPALDSKNISMEAEFLNATVAKSASSLGSKDAIIVKPLPSGIYHVECLDTMSPETKLINKGINGKDVNHTEMKAREFASVSKTSTTHWQPSLGISEIEPSFLSPEARKVACQDEVRYNAEHVSQFLLNTAEKIVGDILHSAMEDIKANQATPTYRLHEKMATSVPSSNFNGKSGEIIQFTKDVDQSSKIPERSLDENYIETPLPLERNEAFQGVLHTGADNENRSFNSTEKVDMHDLFVLKAKEIVNVAINLAKQKVISEQLEVNFDKIHNSNVLTSHTGMSEGPEAMLTLKIEDIINKPSRTKTSEQFSGFFKISGAENYSVPLSLQSVMNCTDLKTKTGEMVQNSMHFIPKNGIMCPDRKAAVGWDPAGISKDLLVRAASEVEIVIEKCNKNNFIKPTGRHQTAHGANRLVSLQMLQTELSSEITELKALPITEGDTDTENLPITVNEDTCPSSETLEGWNCLRLSHTDQPDPKSSFVLQYNDPLEDDEQTMETETHDFLTQNLPVTGFQHYTECEEMEGEDNPSCHDEENNELPEMCGTDDLDSFLAIQAKRFRVYPFSLSPIYEDDSSQEDIISTSGSPCYTSEISTLDSAKQASSILSLLQSVSDRLKNNSRLHEEEESCEEKMPLHYEVLPACEWTDQIKTRELSDEPENVPFSNIPPVTSLDPSVSNQQRNKCQKKLSLARVLTDPSHSVPESDTGPRSSAASRSVYYQYLQAAKTYSFDNEVKLGSIFEDMLLPKEPPEEDFLKAALLVNHIDREGLKCNPRPGKMVIYNVSGSKNKLEICGDVLNATSWTFSDETLIRVVRGCWILYDKPMFQGQTCVLEEGETVVTDLWDFNSRRLDPSIIVIGSVRRVQKDSEVPEVEIFPQTCPADEPICVQSEVARLTDSHISIKAGVWLAYSDCHYEGQAYVLEAGQSLSSSLSAEADVKSLRPLKMGGLKVQMPMDPRMVLYEKANFSGWTQELTEHLYMLSDLPSTEREFPGISSIRVIGGVWVAYEKERYKGQQYLLEEGEYEDWQVWGGAGNTLSSFRYIQADFLEPSVSLFEMDIDGKKLDIVNREIPDLEEAGFGTETRSIYVQNGVWVAYQQKHYSGKQYVLEKGRYKNCVDWGASDNTILSIRPVMLEPLGRKEPQHLLKAYNQENFQGMCVDVTAEVSDFVSPSSIKVLRGCWLLGYKFEMADYYCVLEEGHYPNLASCGCPTADIKFLQPVEHVFAEPSISLFALDSCEGRELHFEDAAHSILNEDLHFYTQSVRVESGLWIMYEGASFLGRQVLLEPCEIPNWMQFSGWKAVGSLRPVRQPTVYLRIKNQAEEKYLTVTGKLKDIRASSVCLSAWNGKDTQIWYYRRGLIKSKVMGACLDVIGGREVPGSKVALWIEHGKPRQKWKFHKDGTISCYLNDQLLLDVKGGKYYDKTHIVVNHPLGDKLLQKWAIEIL
ncbi:very large A-kinase anchor protein [Microcaecilia unicolor]|uniref:Very large A-kinase anchor protein n=1 Tax=Microcaecilia unicolor TaxID=1415580 RepID=A0A6P7YAR6_9AMPH|nr:very large A-kinase anchor protein [Microcaecilia unicolor]